MYSVFIQAEFVFSTTLWHCHVPCTSVIVKFREWGNLANTKARLSLAASGCFARRHTVGLSVFPATCL